MDTRLIVSFVECVSEKHVRGERLAVRVVEIGIRGVDRRVRFEIEEDGSIKDEHKALNKLIQGSAAHQTKKALVALDDAGFPPRPPRQMSERKRSTWAS